MVRGFIGAARNTVKLAMPLAALLLTACGPRIDGYVDKVAGRLLTIENKDSSAFTVTRIIVNGNRDSSSCNDYPNKTLSPGESYSTTFVFCGPVHNFTVETDRGATHLSF